MTHDYDVIVVGGGLAGLAAGATAARAGARAVVLEAHQPGGRARVSEKRGFVFNHGGHALYLGGAGARVLHELGVTPVGSRPPLDRYRLSVGGELHRLPTGPTSLLSTTALGKRSKVQLAKLLGLLPRLAPSRFAGQSVDEWIGARDLRPDAELVVRALVRIGTYGAAHSDLGADAAIEQLQIGAKRGVLYLDGGWAQLVEGLAAQVEVRTGSTVVSVDADADGVAVAVDGGRLIARAVVIAPGTPAATRALLPDAPPWGDVGEPLTASCIDAAVRRVPDPGYVLWGDEPLYGTLQGPPARQAPAGQGVVAAIRYGARSAVEDRPDLERVLSVIGVGPDDVVHERFLARMTVTGAIPRAVNGGMAARPAVGGTGSARAFIAGDWVGPDGLLADTSLASGHEAARAALRAVERAPSRVA